MKFIKLITTENSIDISCSISDFALAKSGTNVIQFIVKKIPTIIYYKANFITACIVKLMLKTKLVNPINIMAKRIIVPEFYQEKATVKNLIIATNNLLLENNAKKQIKECGVIINKLICKGKNTNENILDIIKKTLNY